MPGHIPTAFYLDPEFLVNRNSTRNGVSAGAGR